MDSRRHCVALGGGPGNAQLSESPDVLPSGTGIASLRHVAVIVLLTGTAFFSAFAPSVAAASQFVTPGRYEGTTTQRCPNFAANAGECALGENLPVSFTATNNAVSDLLAVVIEHCEDFLPPRLGTVEIQGPLLLTRETNRKSFATLHNWNAALRKTGAVGFIKRRVANGYISSLSKVAEDTYCYVRGVQWRAASR